MAISVFMFVSRKNVQIGLSMSANVPGLNVLNLQSTQTPIMVKKRDQNVIRCIHK